MLSLSKSAKASLVLALLAIVLLGLACAKAEKAAPAPSAPAPAPVAAPAPAAKPAPAAASTPAPAPAVASAPATATGPQPLVPGGPPFFRAQFENTLVGKHLREYNETKFPLWTKAIYGGEHRSGIYTNWIPSLYLDTLNRLHLSRPSYMGMLLLIDMGRCSMIGREDFSKCNGKYGKIHTTAIIPGIFERWEEPDPLTYVFHVRKGVLWPARPPMNRTDREVTADDIVWFLNLTKNEGVLGPNLSLTKTIEAVDRYTVKVSMQAPHADFLLNLAHTSMGIFPKECYEEKDCLGNKHITPGPFLLAVSDLRVKGIFERNPEFHIKGLPYVDRMTFLGIVDPQTLKAAFISGQIDTIVFQTPPEMQFMKERVPGLQVMTANVLGGPSAWRMMPKGPLADVRVRRALAMTIDHESMWQVARKGFDYLPTLVPRNKFGDEFFLTLQQGGEYYQFNPERAKKLLAEAGYPEGFSTTFWNPSPALPDQVLHLQANWKRYLNVDLRVKAVDRAANDSAFWASSWDGFITVLGWNLTFWADADAPFLQMVKGSVQNREGWNDPVINDLHVKQRGELDPAKRAALLWEFEQYELTQIYAVRIGGVVGFDLMQPWEMNGVMHEVAWFANLNGPTWLAMHNTSISPGGR